MVLQYLILPCAAVDVSVYFRCGNTLMAKHLLHNSKVRTMLQKMCRKGMAEGVWRYFLPYTSRQRLSLDHSEH